MQLKALLILFLTLNFSIVFAQNTGRLFSEAESYAAKLSYPDAIKVYQNLLKNSSNLSADELRRAQLGIAYNYFLIRNYINSEKYYSLALGSFPKLKDNEIEAYKRYAQVLGLLGKYPESEKYWNKYLDLTNDDGNNFKFRNIYNKIGPLQRNKNSYNVEYLKINSGFPDFSPVYFDNGLVFVSGRTSTKAIRRVFGWDNSNFLDLYFLDNLKLLDDKDSAIATLSTSSNSSGFQPNPNRGLDTSFFTLPTANDSAIPGKSGSNSGGLSAYKENPLIPAVKFSKKLNSKYHEGPAVFYNDYKNIVFTRNVLTKSSLWSKLTNNDVTRLKLFTAEMVGNKWVNISQLNLGNENYSYGHPALSSNGKILFFVSDMPGGYGGTDIYYTIFENGKWGVPVNAGSEINTTENEMFPFLDEGGNLYFSSDGHPGLGGLDMFVVKMDLKNRKSVSLVRNLGAPLNSSFDDFGIITDEERREGYFSSNRKRGGNDDDIYKFTRVGALFGCRDLTVSVYDSLENKGLRNFRFGIDVKGMARSFENYTTNAEGLVNLCLEADKEFNLLFEYAEYEKKEIAYSNLNVPDGVFDTIKVYLKRKILEPDADEYKEPLIKQNERLIQNWTGGGDNFFKVLISNAAGDPIVNAYVKFINLCNGTFQGDYTDSDGFVIFSRDINCDYELVSEKDGYTISRDIISKLIEKNILGKAKPIKNLSSESQLFNAKLYKIGDVIRMPNIYYSTDEFKLSKDAKKGLDKLVDVMKKYPEMAVEVSSHTDSRGNALVNLDLSQKRAEEVLKYLSKQVDKGRIKAIGKGETEPVNNCGDGVQCTEKEYARNRRTEFKILKMERN